MKFSTLLLIFLLFAAYACNKDELVPPEQSNTKTAITIAPLTADNLVVPAMTGHLKKATPTRPMKFLNSSGSFEIRMNDEACSETGLQAYVWGSGNATFLGAFDVVNLYCVDMMGNPASPIQGFLTAANGDQMFTQVIDAWIDMDTGENFLVYMIIGGTGRFQNASGEWLIHGWIDYENSTWDLTGEGEIAF